VKGVAAGRACWKNREGRKVSKAEKKGKKRYVRKHYQIFLATE